LKPGTQRAAAAASATRLLHCKGGDGNGTPGDVAKDRADTRGSFPCSLRILPVSFSAYYVGFS